MKNILLNMESAELNKLHPYDIASQLEHLDELDAFTIFNKLDGRIAAEVFVHLDKYSLNHLIELQPTSQFNDYLNYLELNDFFEVVNHLEPQNIEKLDAYHLELYQSISTYPKDSAGQLLSKHFLVLSPQNTIKETIDLLRASSITQLDDRLFLSENNKLVGEINTKNLLLFPVETKLIDFMEETTIRLHAHMDKEEVAKIFSDYDFWVLPVVNNANDFIGIINVDDILDIITEEADEDILGMSGVSSLNDSYLETSVLHHVKKRIGWLLALMFSATITGALISQYDHAFEAVPLLVSFIPMLMDTGGNSGSQSSTLVIRGLATHDIELSDFLKVFIKEFRVSVVISLILALANALRIYLVYGDLAIAVVVSSTLVFTVIVSKLIGATLPLLAKKMNFDPAVMVSPIITTVVDTWSIFIYFQIAMYFFNL